MSRYKALTGSDHGCCFDGQVVDLTKPVMIGDKQYRDDYEVVCETWDLESAERIASALNQQKD